MGIQSRRSLSRGWLVLAGVPLLLAVLGGCASRMRMPPAELVWVREANVPADSPRFEEISRVREVDGYSDYSAHRLLANRDESLVAAAVTLFGDPLSGNSETAESKSRLRGDGMVIWRVADGTTEFVAIPRRYSEVSFMNNEPVCWSADDQLLVVQSDERLMIWSRLTKQFLGVCLISDEPMVTAHAGGGHTISSKAAVNSLRFNEGQTVLVGDVWRARLHQRFRVEWDVHTGRELSRQQIEWPAMMASAPTLPQNLEGCGPGEHVASQMYPSVQSTDGRYIAAAFQGRGVFLCRGDGTPGHTRVWDQRTGRLQCWSGETKGWGCQHPMTFVGPQPHLLSVDAHAIQLVDVSARRVLAEYGGHSRRVEEHSFVWLPKSQVVCGIVDNELIAIALRRE